MNEKLKEKLANRPQPPVKAVVTAGMPYGDKELHLGHIGGVFLRADSFARFLRDRIGGENVVFVSGTDCYGSPLTEGHRKRVESGEFSGTAEDFAQKNHEHQKQTLKDYQVDINLFAASALDRAREVHSEMSEWVLRTLHENGHLTALSTPQFYDPVRQVYLNGRQVVGRCPIAGCSSEKGYADECDMGHQYPPDALIAPKSMLSGETPEMRESKNWYLDTGRLRPYLDAWLAEWRSRPTSLHFAVSAIEEFLALPVIYLKRDILDENPDVLDGLPPHDIPDRGEEKKPSATIVFQTLTHREEACALLSAKGMRYRTGKTIVPFRLTGDTEWGVSAPALDGLEGKTFWVWPESLWAPISFTQTYLESMGQGSDAWKQWWQGSDAKVYQFMGQDCIYFYGPAQAMLFLGLQGKSPRLPVGDDDLLMTDLMVCHHVLFLNKKASSSGSVKPPMAKALLEHYTSEQLRAHFLGMGLGLRNVSFQPKPLNPDAKPGDPDPVLKEHSLFTNVLNRVARSCFYTAQKYTDSRVPRNEPTEEARDMAAEAALDFEQLMLKGEFHTAMNVLDSFYRNMNKYWSARMKAADTADDMDARLQVLADCFYMLRVAAVLAHPVAPDGTERLAKYLNLDKPGFFDWEGIFQPLSHFMADPDAHRLMFLEPRTDFYLRHSSQMPTADKDSRDPKHP